MAEEADKLPGRRCRLTITTPVVTPGDFTGTTSRVLLINGGEEDPTRIGLRVQFKIAKTLAKEPNTSEIIVTNLSAVERGALQVKGVKCVLEAGYRDSGLTQIFRGDVRTVDHVRNGADWESTLKLGSGERAYRFARVSESFSGPVGAGTVIQFLAERSGLALGNVPTEVANILKTYDHGYTVSGSWSKEMDKVVKAVGYTWSVQDEALQILLPNSSLKASIPLLSPETGLIGSPEMGTPEKKGKPALMKFRALLTPLRCGGQVQINCERYRNKFLKVKKVHFSGDTHGAAWYVDGEGQILSDN